ncbi:MAG TPA: HD domain-containing phosphohydrolase [Pyrinomonadaceae bacterium]|nr:HD domain-containing phosphohydrolase [Pyrinomonadaceae bacterium]
MQYKILFVDDESPNLRLLERLFRGSYELFTAESGARALETLAVHDIAVIISDQRMPEMTGIDFLKKAAEMRPQTVRIMLTGYTDAEALVEAINSGVVYKYMTKPWNNDELRNTVKRALQHYETIKGQRRLQLQNERLMARIRGARMGQIRLLSEMLDLKEPRARVFAEKVRTTALALGESVGLERAELDRLGEAAFLSEAANLRIPPRLLSGTRTITEPEVLVMREGFKLGIGMLEELCELEDVTTTLRYSFETYDGSGFPSGFAAEQIPIEARIIALAREYCLLVYPRNGETQVSHEQAVKTLQGSAGKKLDPNLIELFCSPRRNHNVEPAGVPGFVYA